MPTTPVIGRTDSGGAAPARGPRLRAAGENEMTVLSEMTLLSQDLSRERIPATVPDELVVTSRTDGGVIMGVQHADLPIYGVQFHPESVLTQGGYRMLGNWLSVAGLPEAAEIARGLKPLVNLS